MKEIYLTSIPDEDVPPEPKNDTPTPKSQSDQPQKAVIQEGTVTPQTLSSKKRVSASAAAILVASALFVIVSIVVMLQND